MIAVHPRPIARIRTLVADGFVAAWVIISGLGSWALKGVVDAIATPIEQLGTTTADLGLKLEQARSQLSSIPLVGQQIADQFAPLDGVVNSYHAQAIAQAEQVHQIAWWVFIAVWMLGCLPVLVSYLVPRIRLARERAAVTTILVHGSDLSLLALRAMARVPLNVVAKTHPDPVAAWRSGDSATINILADLELNRVGLERG